MRDDGGELLQFLVLALQRGLVRLVLGDVLDLRDEMHRLAIQASDQRHAQQHPDQPTGLVKVPFLHPVGRNLPVQQLVQQAEVGVQVFGMGDGLEVRGEQLLALVTHDLA